MPCAELDKLRSDVRQLQTRMKELRAKSASSRSKDRRDDPRHADGSSLDLLKRRIARASAQIESHVAKHGCHH